MLLLLVNSFYHYFSVVFSIVVFIRKFFSLSLSVFVGDPGMYKMVIWMCGRCAGFKKNKTEKNYMNTWQGSLRAKSPQLSMEFYTRTVHTHTHMYVLIKRFYEIWVGNFVCLHEVLCKQNGRQENIRPRHPELSTSATAASLGPVIVSECVWVNFDWRFVWKPVAAPLLSIFFCPKVDYSFRQLEYAKC